MKDEPPVEIQLRQLLKEETSVDYAKAHKKEWDLRVALQKAAEAPKRVRRGTLASAGDVYVRLWPTKDYVDIAVSNQKVDGFALRHLNKVPVAEAKVLMHLLQKLLK